jgi:hypothetical protein
MSVIFRNKGVIDPKSITTFGISSKENASAIGFFGTGLKYAIAILLRLGCSIRIISGGKEYNFGTREVKIRVDNFKLITMNKRSLGFTTELGKTWQLWQAFREIYCNCKDEHGDVFECAQLPDLSVADDETAVIVEGSAFAEIWRNRSTIVLPDMEPIIKTDGVEIYPGASNFVFYRGIRAYQLDRPSKHTYNITRATELTEDRTIKYTWDVTSPISQSILECSNSELIESAVTSVKENFEHSLSFNNSVPSETFANIVGELARSYKPVSESAVSAVRTFAHHKLQQEGVSMKLSEIDQERLTIAIDFCKSIGFDVDAYPIVVSEFLGENVLGAAVDGKIFVSTRTFMMGTKMLAGTLVEEYIHLRHGLWDCSRGLQNFLFDTICSLGERVNGKPL